MAPHSSALAWKILWTEEPGGLQSMGSLRVGHDWVASLSLSCIGEGNGNPLQCSCLENPRDGGAWWAAVYGVTQSQTRLKRLSSRIYSWMFLLRLLPRTPRFPWRYFYLWVVVKTSVLWTEYCRKFLFYYPTHSHSLDPRLYVIFLELCPNIVQRDLE